jgi:hypothetical protein
MTEETYKALEQVQNYCCKICGLHKSENRHGILHVDHDHKTDEIRGLLCDNCNKMLGFARDNQTILLKAIHYLKRQL